MATKQLSTPASRPDPTVDLTAFKALVFDLDGVITRTATIHAAAWKRLFDGFLERRARELQVPFKPFEIADYLATVDGKRRYDGVQSFLESRGIMLPWGIAADPAGESTVCGLGNAKNRLFATPSRAARDIVRAIDRGAREAYVPWYWRPILWVVRNTPEALFQRLGFLSDR